jgi:hypothetical protein
MLIGPPFGTLSHEASKGQPYWSSFCAGDNSEEVIPLLAAFLERDNAAMVKLLTMRKHFPLPEDRFSKTMGLEATQCYRDLVEFTVYV